MCIHGERIMSGRPAAVNGGLSVVTANTTVDLIGPEHTSRDPQKADRHRS
jgi:hypothetical protein